MKSLVNSMIIDELINFMSAENFINLILLGLIFNWPHVQQNPQDRTSKAKEEALCATTVPYS